MRLQPRQQLLEVWRATVRSSVQDGKWSWGGRGRANSISDAEQLLCLMLPATTVESFGLDEPDATDDEVARALRGLGDPVEIPQRLVRVLTEYMRRYTDDNGTPVFSGDSYFRSSERDREPTHAQTKLDVVDSFAVSVTLALATIGFVRVFRAQLRREDIRVEVDTLEKLASTRLTAAMVGLLRSFTVSVFDADSPLGRALVRTTNQSGLPARHVIDDLRRALRQVAAALREVTIGSGAAQVLDLENPHRLFECGWSWGIVKDAPRIDLDDPAEDARPQPDGVAEAAPYLYFTMVALDGIAALFSERTRILGLLTEEQQRLARALQLRWDLTQQYWATIASFGPGRWPLEDLPWRTTDEVENDHLSLLVSAVTVQDLESRRGSDAALDRVGQVLEELAARGRVTRRPVARDPAVTLHSPGVSFELVGSGGLGGPRLTWVASDFSPLLLKRMLQVARLVRDTDLRGRLLAQADLVWDHLVKRRLVEGAGRDLWDQPSGAFSEIDPSDDSPSWYYTERVVECLVAAANLLDTSPLRSGSLAGLASELLNEADHLFDRELLSGGGESGPALRHALQNARAALRRARQLLDERPGTAYVLASDVLRELDRLAAARQSVFEAD
ncbi:SCO2524 family protein [Phytohabitans sp. ZYX-F-186]|uniref:SCO2524 family protein n=1 Tax=Phytohabitans maris TaxID=3071409 RepID=A0ABU0ZB54_9ACTN|nr:SCO2524 family protein [Phytohabitans sp. ZYX-F-186]MDQ7904273.1 SCO2524 family protein [Phytohabitans sp. ZYX-F-186]